LIKRLIALKSISLILFLSIFVVIEIDVMTELLDSSERLSGLKPLFSRVFPEKVSLDLTVAIPTFNGAERLPDLLERLRWQLNVEYIDWEIIVVDNNSTDHTAQVVKDFQRDWPTHCPLYYWFEPKQGAANARNLAMQKASGELVGFLDDDNLPHPLWVWSAYQFGQEHPKAGAYGSRIYGDFEVEPPANFERISAFLALTERGDAPLLYYPAKKILPPSAGIVVRRQAWLDHVPENLVLTGRAGKSMLTGEDIESVLHIQRAGWEVWYNPAMRVAHKIPGKRLTREYFSGFFRGIGFSRFRTRMLSFPRWQRPLILPLYMVNDLLKIVKHILKYRLAVWRDDVAAGEMTLYLASLISPFFMIYYTLQKRWQ
jgi:glycosyltransferase involved in cell wall biosynthesis